MQIIASGVSSVIYDLENEMVLKLFKENYAEINLEREFSNNVLINQTGIKTAQIIGKTELYGRYGILLEKLEGATLKELINKKPWLIFRYARSFAQAHAAMLNCECPGLPMQKEDLKEFIGIKRFSPDKQNDLLGALEKLPEGMALCHNDFSPSNVMMCADGYYTIDWACANAGDPAMDVADTMLKLKVWIRGPRFSLVRLLKQSYFNLFSLIYRRHVMKLTGITRERIKTWENFLSHVDIHNI